MPECERVGDQRVGENLERPGWSLSIHGMFGSGKKFICGFENLNLSLMCTSLLIH